MKSIIIFHIPYGFIQSAIDDLVKSLKENLPIDIKDNFNVLLIQDNPEFSIKTEVFFNPNIKEKEEITFKIKSIDGDELINLIKKEQ